MGGAFVGVADDASAVYWNPAGLVLGGSYFGLVIDGSFAKSEPDNTPNAGRGNAQLIALSTPPLGLSYYRLESTKLRPLPTFTADPVTRINSLTTHHAGVTLVHGDLRGIERARRLSRATLRNIRENLFFAFAYNALGVPIAAGLLYPAFGWRLSPMLAAAAMSLSSVSVIANALRLRRTRV